MADLQHVTKRWCCGTDYMAEHDPACKHLPPPDYLEGDRPPMEASETIEMPTLRRGASAADKLWLWWVDLAAKEAEAVVPKAVEYGSNSLVDVGHQMARQAGRTVNDEEAAELAVYFYVVGKMGRWADALVAGKRVSDDTLHDIGVYIRMAQRIREVGSWPGVDLEEK